MFGRLESEDIKISVTFTIESICHQVFDDLADLLKNKIVNQDLAQALNPTEFSDWQEAKAEYFNRFTLWDKKMNSPKVMIARCSGIAVVLMLAFLLEISLQENSKHSLTKFVLQSLCFALLVKLYQMVFASIPLESVGTSFLNKKEKEHCEKMRAYEKTYLQANNALFAYFPIVKEEHPTNAMLRALFGIKNKSFDCVSITALTILKLIEKKLPATIEWIKKRGMEADGHNFVLVNRDLTKSFTNLNDDCMLIDAWYGLCLSIKEVKADPDFFKKYPLLEMSNKSCQLKISGSNPPQGYFYYLKKLNEILQPNYRHCVDRMPLFNKLAPRL